MANTKVIADSAFRLDPKQFRPMQSDPQDRAHVVGILGIVAAA